VSLDEARSNGLGLERASSQRGAMNASAQPHELAEVYLATSAGADADDRNAAAGGK
jgi:hypothetical protein